MNWRGEFFSEKTRNFPDSIQNWVATRTKTVEISKITATIEQLRQLSQVNLQASWRVCFADLSLEVATRAETWQTWNTLSLNARGHLAWEKGSQVLWLGQRLKIPQRVQGYPVEGLVLRLALTWWAESAQIYVNGQLVQEGDLFDCVTRILLSNSVIPDETIDLALRLVSPEHDDGALVRSLCVYESPQGIDPGFVADELTVLLQYLETFAPDQLPQLAAMENLSKVQVSDRPEFLNTLQTLRQELIEAGLNIGENGKLPQISLLGHAHLDLAWLWPMSETWDAAQRTFTSVLKLQQVFPNLTFCHSTPALYNWVEQHCPDLFKDIQKQIQSQKWEIVGGLWVEPELNTVSGESIVRQVLYGQHYCLEKFGQVSKVAWLPDTFGFCWQLPQILKLGQIQYFVTQKLRWNDTTPFPYQIFFWRSPDGSEILSFMSSPIGEGIDPVKMGSYAVEWQKQTELQQALWLFGVGDHGGGPTRDMLEVAERWQASPFFPKLTFSTSEDYLHQLESNTQLPVWDDELYLEFHRGCYTSHADQKLFNRRSEQLLYQAELWSSLATLIADQAYPKLAIEAAWKKVLFNQFHDILPGSAIASVYQEANQDWQAALRVSQDILEDALSAIASHITLPNPPQPNAKPILIFNSLNWQRSELVAIPISDSRLPVVYNVAGQKLPSQIAEDKILFLAADIPAIGYQLFWLTLEGQSSQPEIDDRNTIMENEFLQVKLDTTTGEISQIFDKQQQREILQGAGNQLQAWRDRGQYWDAWNIDPNYSQHPLPKAELKSIQWVTQGTLRQCIRVVHQIGQSEFIQDYILDCQSRLLKIATKVNWQEDQVLVKAAFSFNLEANNATYEIPFGAIQRTTQPQTPAEKAKWEVPALNWADLSDHSQTFGVSLFNDCKYGYDAQSDRLRLTLLRSPRWPDPECDRGYHEFTYAVYPHAGSWQTAETVKRGYELNIPLQVKILSPVNSGTQQALPPVSQLLDLGTDNLILTAFKQSEVNPHQWILRGYECYGQSTQFKLKSRLNLQAIQAVDLLEQPLAGESDRTIKPWQITTWLIQPGEVTQELSVEKPY